MNSPSSFSRPAIHSRVCFGLNCFVPPFLHSISPLFIVKYFMMSCGLWSKPATRATASNVAPTPTPYVRSRSSVIFVFGQQHPRERTQHLETITCNEIILQMYIKYKRIEIVTRLLHLLYARSPPDGHLNAVHPKILLVSVSVEKMFRRTCCLCAYKKMFFHFFLQPLALSLRFSSKKKNTQTEEKWENSNGTSFIPKNKVFRDFSKCDILNFPNLFSLNNYNIKQEKNLHFLNFCFVRLTMGDGQ